MNNEAEQKLNERIDVLTQQVQMLANTVALLSKIVAEAPQKLPEPRVGWGRYPTGFAIPNGAYSCHHVMEIG